MLLTFILGIAAGFFAGLAEPKVKMVLETVMPGSAADMDAAELRAVSLGCCVLVAAVCSWVFASSHVMPLAIGVIAGVLGPRLRNRFRAMRAPDYDS